MHQKSHRVYPTSSVRQKGGVLRALLGLLIVAALSLGGGAYWWLNQPLRLSSPSIELSVETGATPRDIARDWVEAGVDASPWMLYQWFKLSGQSRQMRAGSYELAQGSTPRDLLRMMVRGDERLSAVRLIDGWTFRRFRAELAQADGLKQTTAGLSDAEIMVLLGEPGAPAEGHFFPDTYSYAKGSTDLAVMKRALHAMQKHLDAAWAQRQANTSVKTPQEALTLASIVEKETGRESDRPMISGVFNNRLRIGMPLQTDPTVIYGLGEQFDGNLRRVHLQTDTPFNTYTRTGLPPTPIAMPGKAALLAAVRPADTKALYFVARGDGSSAFSATLAEHNRAVNQYQRAQRNPGKSP
ncbi:MAG: endolytic transglycosylase MltG [Aquabacterium sp.]|uniref:endolytic transglycosylase MltG n=1 Tax=Aquabacterium sp. TaxID=1872578 RepID=UPI0025BBB096|nr:endolytic transglycosylase MltG [Aquabacterium sp.]MBI5927283.1 endolytic transglycosylase MltG [Aquabacterium sp.]